MRLVYADQQKIQLGLIASCTRYSHKALCFFYYLLSLGWVLPRTLAPIEFLLGLTLDRAVPSSTLQAFFVQSCINGDYQIRKRVSYISGMLWTSTNANPITVSIHRPTGAEP
ncbi:hypothetical protein OMCYN_01674 [cyanobiont of Ornithocercus magnificus]|nr:hypothetical protein OMCYN_01674 [cyanobiont of Ornithocercus magnificus]